LGGLSRCCEILQKGYVGFEKYKKVVVLKTVAQKEGETLQKENDIFLSRIHCCVVCMVKNGEIIQYKKPQ
jgi:hypothetical protein